MRQGTLTTSRDKPVNLGRHQSGCKICSHPQREEIERDFITWKSPTPIVKQYGLADRTSIYRHAHALGLFAKRSRNVRMRSMAAVKSLFSRMSALT
jgi:hypothetical protein